MTGEQVETRHVVVEVLEDLVFSYPKASERRYVVPAGTRLQTGEAGCVLGVSGSGKSTVMTMLAGLRRFERGRVRYSLADGEGMEVSAENWSDVVGPRLWGRIGFAFQRPELIRSLTAAGNLRLVNGGDVAPDLFDRSEWRDVVESRVWRLSGGQVQRLGLIRAFAKTPRLAFLDEPTNNLDRDNRVEVGSYIRRRRRDCALMVVSHDAAFVESLAVDRLFKLERQVVDGRQTRTLRAVAPQDVGGEVAADGADGIAGRRKTGGQGR